MDLAREVHESVIQRLFGIQLVFSSMAELTPGGPRAHRRRAAGRARRPPTRPAAPAQPQRTGNADDAAGGGRAPAHASTATCTSRCARAPSRSASRRARAAGPVRAGRGRPQRAQARGPEQGRGLLDVKDGDTLVLDVINDGVRTQGAPARHGPQAGGAGGVAGGRDRGVRRARAGHLARADWRCRLTGPDLNPSRIATGSSDRKLRVLVVDDHEVVHWGLRMMLGEQPWVERTLSARNTEEALALARRYDPHVALVDLFVGQESGAEICQQLLALSPAPERPADLRRRPHLAQRRQGGGRVRLHLQGLAGGGHRRRGADGRSRHDRLQAARVARRAAALRTRARSARGRRVRRDQPRDRRPALPLPPHGQGAHVVACTASSACETAPKRSRRPSVWA